MQSGAVSQQNNMAVFLLHLMKLNSCEPPYGIVSYLLQQAITRLKVSVVLFF